MERSGGLNNWLCDISGGYICKYTYIIVFNDCYIYIELIIYIYICMYTTSNHDMYINDVSFIVYIAISMVYTLMCSTT